MWEPPCRPDIGLDWRYGRCGVPHLGHARFGTLFYNKHIGSLRQEVAMLRSQRRLVTVPGLHSPRAMLVAAAVIGGSLLASWILSRIVVSGPSPLLALRAQTVTPAVMASVTTTFDIHAVISGAPANAPVQHAGVIACTYVLKDGHRCD